MCFFFYFSPWSRNESTKIERQSILIQFALALRQSCYWIGNCHLNFAGISKAASSPESPESREMEELLNGDAASFPPLASTPNANSHGTETELNGIPRPSLNFSHPQQFVASSLGSWLLGSWLLVLGLLASPKRSDIGPESRARRRQSSAQTLLAGLSLRCQTVDSTGRRKVRLPILKAFIIYQHIFKLYFIFYSILQTITF